MITANIPNVQWTDARGICFATVLGIRNSSKSRCCCLFSTWWFRTIFFHISFQLELFYFLFGKHFWVSATPYFWLSVENFGMKYLCSFLEFHKFWEFFYNQFFNFRVPDNKRYRTQSDLKPEPQDARET